MGLSLEGAGLGVNVACGLPNGQNARAIEIWMKGTLNFSCKDKKLKWNRMQRGKMQSGVGSQC